MPQGLFTKIETSKMQLMYDVLTTTALCHIEIGSEPVAASFEQYITLRASAKSEIIQCMKT